MIFIDTSAYLSALLPDDPNREKAIRLLTLITTNGEQLITSYAILGEVLTVSSQDYDRQIGLQFVQDILKGPTKVILEDTKLIQRALEVFESIKDKDVGWVDCYSFAIIEQYKVDKVFSFDKDFKKYSGVEILR